jgi:regulator of protease activity HflC (stomatin/prohibitin superfamily)
MSQKQLDYEAKYIFWGCIVGFFLLAGSVFGACWGCPQYDVWQKGLKGQAELKRATYNRKIAIRAAEAKYESAKSLAKAEIERAKGVAKANKIIGESLRKNEAYLRYLWIMGLQDGSSEVIYIPTEANLPILEATRRLKGKK